jgi:hypothetical protein
VTSTPTQTTTPTVTATSTSTATPTITPTATITPAPEVPFRSDQLQLIELPASILDGIDDALIVFTNRNDQQTITNIATAQPENTTEILYFAQPGSRERIEITRFNSDVGSQYYIAPQGKAIAVFQPGGEAPGMYIINVVTSTAFSTRIWNTSTLTQRGILSPPAWTADGESLALTLDSGYALDIYLYSRDGSNRENLTASGAYDMLPAFSPDGRYMAFVSDRATCPSWTPGDEGFCDSLQQPPPYGGFVYLMDLRTREVSLLFDQFVTEAPRWINSQSLVIASGDQTDLLNPQRQLWLANISSATLQPVQIANEEPGTLYLDDAWTDDASTLIVQRASPTTTDIVLMRATGEVLRARSTDLTFARFGISADWSALGTRVAIGGVSGQCPYGIRVADEKFDWIATGNQPSMCDPIYSPDGLNMAFTGVTAEADGRLDVYSANENGFGAVNLTIDLRGTMNLVGWIGGTVP